MTYRIEKNDPDVTLPLGHCLGIVRRRNVFGESWPSLVKVVLVASAVLFVIIRWA
jgi:hypothetical protein